MKARGGTDLQGPQRQQEEETTKQPKRHYPQRFSVTEVASPCPGLPALRVLLRLSPVSAARAAGWQSVVVCRSQRATHTAHNTQHVWDLPEFASCFHITRQWRSPTGVPTGKQLRSMLFPIRPMVRISRGCSLGPAKLNSACSVLANDRP